MGGWRTYGWMDGCSSGGWVICAWDGMIGRWNDVCANGWTERKRESMRYSKMKIEEEVEEEIKQWVHGVSNTR